MVVNQWVPAAHRGDAIGDSARAVRDLLRAQGHDADIYALAIDENMRGDARPFADPAASTGDVTILHFALPSPMTEAFARLPRGRVLQYHNITPARFYAPYDPDVFRLAAMGRRELASLAGRTDLALGDSEYNRRELEALGFADTAVFPVAVNVSRIVDAPRNDVHRRPSRYLQPQTVYCVLDHISRFPWPCPRLSALSVGVPKDTGSEAYQRASHTLCFPDSPKLMLC